MRRPCRLRHATATPLPRRASPHPSAHTLTCTRARARAESLLGEHRRRFQADGFCLLPEFVTGPAAAAMASEANALAHKAHFSSSSHDIYLAPPEDGTPSGRTSVGSIPNDAFGLESELQRLYNDDTFCDFLSSVIFGKPAKLHRLVRCAWRGVLERSRALLPRPAWSCTAMARGAAAVAAAGLGGGGEEEEGGVPVFVHSQTRFHVVRPCTWQADEIGACTVNVYNEGDAHFWHFDESAYSVTLMLQTSEEGGGEFFAVPNARSGWDDGA